MKKYFVGLIMCFMLCLSVPMITLADFGGYSSSGGSGGYSGGGSGGYSGGGSGSYALGGHNDYDSTSPFEWFLIAFYLLIRFIYLLFEVLNFGYGTEKAKCYLVDENTLMPVSEYMQKYSCPFDEENFKRNITRLYVELQHEWTQKDITPCKAYLCDKYYKKMKNMLQRMVNKGLTNYVEKIDVSYIKFIGMKREKNKNNEIEHMYIKLYTNIVDYTINDRENILVEGNRTDPIQMKYEWHLIRDGKAPVILRKSDRPINLNGWKLAEVKGCRMLPLKAAYETRTPCA